MGFVVKWGALFTPSLTVGTLTGMSVIPEHVRVAFQVVEGTPIPLSAAWDRGYRVGQLALSEVADSEVAAWSAKVRESLQPEGLRIARPVRTTDGRYLMAGWRASHYVDGAVAKRVDETVGAALRLADALASVEVPNFAVAHVTKQASPKDNFVLADRAAWSEDPTLMLNTTVPPDVQATEKWAWALDFSNRLRHSWQPIDAPDQVGHADMLATTIFHGTQAPVVTDIVGVAHPHGYTAAQVMVDGLIAGVVDERITDRFSHLPDNDQLMLRGLLYRIYIHALSEEHDETVRATMEDVADLLIARIGKDA